MVVWLDLDDDGTEQARPSPENGGVHRFSLKEVHDEVSQINDGPREETRNEDSGLSKALTCYPVASQLATCLDLNSLHELSRTCLQIRMNLLQYRSQLIAHTLRCENEEESRNLGPRLGEGLREVHAAWDAFGANGVLKGRMTSGKVGLCARDMVGECRKCGRIVCRNCIIKQPPLAHLKDRHRRLCRTCMKAPLEKHTSFTPGPMGHEATSDVQSFTHPAFARESCKCAEHVWICQPCGQSARTEDVTYVRGWSWRKRYHTNLSGLGTGPGEGIEGVTCGRRSACLASREVEKEICCTSGEAETELEAEKAKFEGRARGGSGYFMQEIEGIGGVMQKKVKKRERVGEEVKEYEDEREHGDYLDREHTGRNRSWCNWCQRVIPSKKDCEKTESTDDGSTSQSSSPTQR